MPPEVIDMLKQIQETAGVLIEVLGSAEAGGAPAEGGAPPAEGGTPPEGQ